MADDLVTIIAPEPHAGPPTTADFVRVGRRYVKLDAVTAWEYTDEEGVALLDVWTGGWLCGTSGAEATAAAAALARYTRVQGL